MANNHPARKQRIFERYGYTLGMDFGSGSNAEKGTFAVLEIISKHLASPEITFICSFLNRFQLAKKMNENINLV